MTDKLRIEVENGELVAIDPETDEEVPLPLHSMTVEEVGSDPNAVVNRDWLEN